MTGVIFVLICFGLPVICGTLITIAKIIKGKDVSSKTISSAKDYSETELIQEIHEGLVRMEKRIGALETIVLETTKENRNTTKDHE